MAQKYLDTSLRRAAQRTGITAKSNGQIDWICLDFFTTVRSREVPIRGVVRRSRCDGTLKAFKAHDVCADPLHHRVY